ncbi:hypothetical protein EDC18_10696 [Natranaerovirga pectinivora]|uniref:Uncharacterized protein n=1 Tax=Natranaerovirga pectinivora TaxID=682400 RepID=A0A4R3MNN5_9FIRM|nr:hypothetical protein [Natranaerovirga pectinivora]TCT14299.1 hypothetical protein EDC18_10696 [Natranaerovirga pectinivora]
MIDKRRPSLELEKYKTISAKEVEVADTALNEDDLNALDKDEKDEIVEKSKYH